MKRRWWALLVVVLASTIASYLPAIDGEFVFDDIPTLLDPLVADPAGIAPSQWLLSPRPLTAATFALNGLAGVESRGWHLVNIALHLGVVVLAFLFARAILERAGLSRPEAPALVAASLFALHPVQTESVAYVTQRAEILAAGLFLGGFLLFLASDRAASLSRRRALLAGATVLHALGLGAKATVATLPAAWLLAAALLPTADEAEQPAWRRAWRRLPATLPAWALTAASAALQLRGTSDTLSAGFTVPGLAVPEYIATEIRVIPTYLRLLAWPSGQCVDWQFPASHGLLELAVLANASLLVAIAGTAVAGARSVRGRSGDGPAAVRLAGFGALFFLLTLAPSSSVIPLLDPLAEHRLYIPALGVFVAVAAVSAAMVWATALTLWSDAAQNAPGKARVQMSLGRAYHSVGLPEQALLHFRLGRDLRGDHTVAPELFLPHIVSALVSLDRFDEARAETDRALARTPRDSNLLAMKAQVEYNAGRDEECERAALGALAIQAHPKALKFLGLLRMRQGNVADAREVFRKLAGMNVIDPFVYLMLGDVEARLGDLRAACDAPAVAVSQPGNAQASVSAARARAAIRCR